MLQWKSTLDLLLETIGPPETRLALSKTDPEGTRDKYIEYIGSAYRSVKIVAGEANGKLFNRSSMATTLRSFLSGSEHSTVDLVFHKHKDINVARGAFQVSNPELAKLKCEFPNRFSIYWSPIRPRQHYVVLDNGEKVILEEPCHEGLAPFWAAVVLDSSRGKEWADRFNDYVKYCKRLELSGEHHSSDV